MSYAAPASRRAYDAVRADFLATGDTTRAIARRAAVCEREASAVLSDVLAGLRAEAEACRLSLLPPERRTTLRRPSRINPETP